MAKMKSAVDFHHGTLNDRLDKLDQYIEDKVSKKMSVWDTEMKDVRTMIGGKSTVTDTLKAHHASMAERLDYLERSFGDSADKHAKALEAAHKRLDQMHGRLQEQLAGHHASIEERMNYVEKLLGDSADKHAAELEAL